MYFLFVALLGMPIWANPYYTIAKPPSWVEEISAPKDSPLLKESLDFCNLLIDNQKKISKNSLSFFYHKTEKVLNYKGIQSLATIEIEFRPANQKVVLHYVRIYRDGKALNRLIPENIKVIQRERDLDKQLYKDEKEINPV